jgi:SAM-dependent methyltransferase
MGVLTEAWGAKVGSEARKSFSRYVDDGFFDKYFLGERILDIGYKGYVDDVTPILPHAVGVDLDFPGYDGKTLPFPDESQDTVFTSHVLEHIEDYRSAIAEWFRVLKIGGFLVLAVPHQYLYERSLHLPSKFNVDHKRFYTPASLLSEVQEALDPFSYRVRMLEDNDREFDYSIEPDRHAGGSYEIVLVLEKIRRPNWSELLLNRVHLPNTITAFQSSPGPQSDDEKVHRVISCSSEVRSVLILKLDHLGDFILATPAMREIRAAFPSAKLVIACGPWNVTSANNIGIFDEIVPVQYFTAKGDGEQQLRKQSSFREALQGRSFDLALDLRIDPDTRELLKETDAKQRAGFGVETQFPFLDISLPILNDTWTNRTFQNVISADRFSVKTGKHLGWEIRVSRGKTMPGSLLIFGPYISLEPGNFVLRLLFEPLNVGLFSRQVRLAYDISHNTGTSTIEVGEFVVREDGVDEIKFRLDHEINDLEFRVRNTEQRIRKDLRFFGAFVRKQAIDTGIHQMEAFAMLVAMVRSRMAYPYKREIYKLGGLAK